MISVRCGTYNIRNTTDRYVERKQLLKDVINDLSNMDVFGLQEVRFIHSNDHIDQTDELIKHSDNFDEFVICKTILQNPFLSSLDNQFRIDGNCIVLNSKSFNLISSSDINLSPLRNAQRVVISPINNDGYRISYTNVHLHHEIGTIHEEIRVQQIQQAIDWISQLDEVEHVQLSILVGDFNGCPTGDMYAYILSRGYISSHVACHGHEPAYTFPTGIQAPTMDTDPIITCDYIFYKTYVMHDTHNTVTVQCIYSELIGQSPSPIDPTIYASDHLGIVSTIQIVLS